MLCYALSISIWAVMDIMFFKGHDVLFREDECLELTGTRLQWLVEFLFKLSVNFAIIVVANLISRGVVMMSLMRRENEPSQDPKRFGFIPLPFWCTVVCRSISFAGVVICLMAMAMMAYSLPTDALNQWLTQLAEAFILQVVSQCLRAGMLHSCWLLFYFKNRERFLERILNPEGDKVACPVCSEYLVIPLNEHMRRHQPRDAVEEVGNLFDGHRIFPRPPVIRKGRPHNPTVSNV